MMVRILAATMRNTVCAALILGLMSRVEANTLPEKVASASVQDLKYKAHRAAADPGPAPALDPADVRAYTVSGRASITGRAMIDFTDRTPLHGGVPTYVYLIPDVPYTRWRLDKWAAVLDAQYLRRGAGSWDGSAMGPLPSALQAGHVGAMTQCDSYGVYTFRDVAPGRYIVAYFFQNSIRIGGSGGGSELQGALMENGSRLEWSMHDTGGAGADEVQSDGWLAHTGSFFVAADQRFVIGPGHYVVTAHFG